tara:strand:- start:3505 stop:4401 length:897 start_codon:yes stop_codon:yes gene_type:complete
MHTFFLDISTKIHKKLSYQFDAKNAYQFYCPFSSLADCLKDFLLIGVMPPFAFCLTILTLAEALVNACSLFWVTFSPLKISFENEEGTDKPTLSPHFCYTACNLFLVIYSAPVFVYFFVKRLIGMFYKPVVNKILREKKCLSETMQTLNEQVTLEKEEFNFIRETLDNFELELAGYLKGLTEMHHKQEKKITKLSSENCLESFNYVDYSKDINSQRSVLEGEKTNLLESMLSNYPQPPQVRKPTSVQLQEFCNEREIYHEEVKELAMLVFDDLSCLTKRYNKVITEHTALLETPQLRL